MSQEEFPKVYEFFDGDEYRSSVLINKYLLRDVEGKFLEDDPKQVIDRVCKTLSKHTNDSKYWFSEFKKAINNFKGVCPQGSILAAAGNKQFPQSLSNCFVIPPPSDTMAGIMRANERMAQVYKRRGGCGTDLSTLRPEKSIVNNAALQSSGAWGWSDHFSNTCRDVAQCLHEESLVLTKKGLKPIKDIKPFKDFVWTENGWVKVAGKISSYKKTYKLKSKYGRELICSKNHILHAAEGEIKLKDLKQGDNITSIIAHGWDQTYKELIIKDYPRHQHNNSNRLKDIDLPNILDEDIAYLLGIIYGDGYVMKKRQGNPSGISIALAKDHPDIINKCRDLVKRIFNLDLILAEGVGNCYKGRIYSSRLVKFLEDNEILKQKSQDIEFPQIILNSPVSVVGSFISGFFDADRSVSVKKKSFKISSISKKFLLSLQCCLNASGIISKIHEEVRNQENWQNLYSITVNGNKSQEKFRELCKDSIKVFSSPPWKKQKDGSRTVYTVKDFNTKSSRHSYIIDNAQHITYSTLHRLSEDLNLDPEDYVLIEDEVESIELYEDRSKVYDLILPNTHLFFCNGLYVHNSGRRGAQMLTLHIQHPDSPKWAVMKNDLKFCTGANVSLFITDEFMNAVKNNEDYTLKFPVNSKNPKVQKTIKAKELWNTICESAHKSAEPGLLMWDHITSTLPAHYYDAFKVVSTNPCSEIPLAEFDACRLISICLTNYVKNPFQDTTEFNFEFFEKDIRTCVRMGEALIEAETEAVNKIIDKVSKERDKEKNEHKRTEYDLEIDLWEKIKDKGIRGRRLGLGDHGWADMFAQLRIKYDSKKAIDLAGQIKRFYRDVAYDESVEIAKEKGSFPEWDWETEKECKFFNTFPEELLKKMKKHGRRHISLLTNAPTGSISTLSGTSSGIEPTFRMCYLRRRKVNPSDTNVRIDFVDNLGDSWQNYLIFDRNVKLYLENNNIKIPEDIDCDEKLSQHLPDYFITSDKIDWKKRVDFQAELTKYVDHSISSTLNLPSDVSVKTVSDVYFRSWEKGIKGVTVYRDGSRSGVLVTKENQEEEDKRPSLIKRQEAPARPTSLPCEVHVVKVDGEEYVVIVGFMGPSVYEVFAGSHSNELPKKRFAGRVEKRGVRKAKYILTYEHEGYIVEKDINNYFKNEQYAAITRLISTGLRHGTPLAFLIDQLNKSSDYMLGFEKSIARVLKKYAPAEDMAKTVKCCDKCESDQIEVRFEEGCATVTCHSCGMVDSKCS